MVEERQRSATGNLEAQGFRAHQTALALEEVKKLLSTEVDTRSHRDRRRAAGDVSTRGHDAKKG